jgi:hypothetical protein
MLWFFALYKTAAVGKFDLFAPDTESSSLAFLINEVIVVCHGKLTHWIIEVLRKPRTVSTKSVSGTRSQHTPPSPRHRFHAALGHRF